MRTTDRLFTLLIAVVAAALGAAPARAFDGPITGAEQQQIDSLFREIRPGSDGAARQAFDRLRDAAKNGNPVALWKLGQMYREGDGVPPDPLKAYQIFSLVANHYAGEEPGSPEARFVASSLVALGLIQLKGIENSPVKANPEKARDILSYAASYFGDADAQFELGRLYLDPVASERDPKTAARWLKLAALKGHRGAQASFGQLLFSGDDGLPRRVVQGLMWLTIARGRASGRDDEWIVEAQEQAFALAGEAERKSAVQRARDWLAKNDRRAKAVN